MERCNSGTVTGMMLALMIVDGVGSTRPVMAASTVQVARVMQHKLPDEQTQREQREQAGQKQGDHAHSSDIEAEKGDARPGPGEYRRPRGSERGSRERSDDTDREREVTRELEKLVK